MDKLGKLKENIKKLDSVVIAFSGGVDSSFLLKVAKSVLPKDNILAVTAVSETYTSSELKQAKDFSKTLGIRHRIIRTEELKDKNFKKNPIERCYYCKNELFGKLQEIAKKEGFANVIDASNADDKKDYRPGSIAKKELGVRSPLQESGITKSEIRHFSKDLGLATWNLPAMACLASRIPYGERIDKDILKRIDSSESFIRGLGIRQVRVRSHKDIARIEVEKKEIKKFLNEKFCDKIIKRLKDLGFRYVTLDMEGYRTGSLNEVLK